MRGALAVTAALVALVAPSAAVAHPLGNFTTNRYSEIHVSATHVYVLYVLDLAEIPTFQAKGDVERVGRAAYARRLARKIAAGVDLRLGGALRPLVPRRSELAFPPGVAGLRTTRLEVLLDGGAVNRGARVRLEYRDRNFRDRIGWKEIVLQADRGARLSSSSVPSHTASDQLRAYPKDLLKSPLDVGLATAAVSAGAGAGVAPALTPQSELDRRVAVRSTGDGGFASLIAHRNLGAGFILLSLLIAFFWGAAHAFSPGHGKSIVAAYLVGTRGTPRQAVLLGLTVTVTHTIGVFALGLITLSLSQFVVPEQLYPWLNLVSALMIVTVGLAILRWRIRDWRGGGNGAGHGHHQHHDHHHGQGEGHDHHHHEHEHESLRLRGLLGVGISGGIIPCPTALVVLLAAIALHRVGYGLVLILAFSIGLAAAMTGIGLLAVSAKRVFNRVDFDHGLVRLLPAVSALIVLALGVAMTVRAIPRVT